MPGIIGRVSFAIMRLGSAFKLLIVNPVFIAITALVALGATFVGIVKNAMAFQVQMSTVKAITGATNEEFKKLRENAILLGKETLKTALEVGQLQVALGRTWIYCKRNNKYDACNC